MRLFLMKPLFTSPVLLGARRQPRRPLRLLRAGLLPLALAAGALHAPLAKAGMTYKLDTVHAMAGETVHVKGMLFNDTDSAMTWTPPASLVLQWRDEQGQAIRSLAYLDTPAQQVNLPVNNFVAFSWRAVVPSAAKGLQAINIEGEPTLLALDTSPLERSPVAGTPATAPLVDAGAGDSANGDPLLPESAVAAAGADASQGPRPVAAAATAAPSAFENFRNAISPFEPVYFDVGNKDGANARFQISFKYRLSTPEDPARPGFMDNLYLGYTQVALWDLDGDSKPFVDTTYNPSLFWQKDKVWAAPQGRFFVGLTSGVEHMSNGKSGADSRSVNDAFVQPEFNYRFDGGSTLTFAPRLKGYFAKPDNDDYGHYAGYVDWKLRWAQDNGLVLSGLYRQGHGGRYATQVDAAWPLRRTFLNMNGYLHVQYFKGYGETLLGYREKSSPQVRVGLSLVP